MGAMSDIQFATSVFPDKSIIHDNETFRVQWKAFNAGAQATSAFTDSLVISNIPEGCPGSDDQEHPIVYDSATDGNPQDFEEPPILPQSEGILMGPEVGPFQRGSYRLTVTLDQGGSDVATFNCIEIVPAV